MHCCSTLNAEPFYQAAGFETVGPIDVPLGASMTFPGISMSCEIAWHKDDLEASPSSNAPCSGNARDLVLHLPGQLAALEVHDSSCRLFNRRKRSAW